MCLLDMEIFRNTHTHTHVCVSVRVCVWERERREYQYLYQHTHTHRSFIHAPRWQHSHCLRRLVFKVFFFQKRLLKWKIKLFLSFSTPFCHWQSPKAGLRKTPALVIAILPYLMVSGHPVYAPFYQPFSQLIKQTLFAWHNLMG
jgi:hypothetical protein